jgi:hypothetical protein
MDFEMCSMHSASNTTSQQHALKQHTLADAVLAGLSTQGWPPSHSCKIVGMVERSVRTTNMHSAPQYLPLKHEVPHKQTETWGAGI